ncbi:MAG: hypothetical protein WCG06_03595, partial [Candidatus Omnitrophota bacterium]
LNQQIALLTSCSECLQSAFDRIDQAFANPAERMAFKSAFIKFIAAQKAEFAGLKNTLSPAACKLLDQFVNYLTSATQAAPASVSPATKFEVSGIVTGDSIGAIAGIMEKWAAMPNLSAEERQAVGKGAQILANSIKASWNKPDDNRSDMQKSQDSVGVKRLENLSKIAAQPGIAAAQQAAAQESTALQLAFYDIDASSLVLSQSPRGQSMNANQVKAASEMKMKIEAQQEFYQFVSFLATASDKQAVIDVFMDMAKRSLGMPVGKFGEGMRAKIDVFVLIMDALGGGSILSATTPTARLKALDDVGTKLSGLSQVEMVATVKNVIVARLIKDREALIKDPTSIPGSMRLFYMIASKEKGAYELESSQKPEDIAAAMQSICKMNDGAFKTAAANLVDVIFLGMKATGDAAGNNQAQAGGPQADYLKSPEAKFRKIADNVAARKEMQQAADTIATAPGVQPAVAQAAVSLTQAVIQTDNTPLAQAVSGIMVQIGDALAKDGSPAAAQQATQLIKGLTQITAMLKGDPGVANLAAKFVAYLGKSGMTLGQMAQAMPSFAGFMQTLTRDPAFQTSVLNLMQSAKSDTALGKALAPVMSQLMNRVLTAASPAREGMMLAQAVAAFAHFARVASENNELKPLIEGFVEQFTALLNNKNIDVASLVSLAKAMAQCADAVAINPAIARQILPVLNKAMELLTQPVTPAQVKRISRATAGFAAMVAILSDNPALAPVAGAILPQLATMMLNNQNPLAAAARIGAVFEQMASNPMFKQCMMQLNAIAGRSPSLQAVVSRVLGDYLTRVLNSSHPEAEARQLGAALVGFTALVGVLTNNADLAAANMPLLRNLAAVFSNAAIPSGILGQLGMVLGQMANTALA